MRPCSCTSKQAKKQLVKSNGGALTQTTPTETAVMENEYTIPQVDIIEEDNEFIIIADMPGVSPDTIDIQFDNGELTIAGEIPESDSEEEIVYTTCQFDPGRYFRNFRIGESIDADGIVASCNDGVLRVQLPKREEVQPRKINVKKA